MTRQYATFTVAGKLYGVDVVRVQEVARKLPLTPVGLAPIYVEGLMNLRGQIATAIGLRNLIEPGEVSDQAAAEMTVVCRSDDGLLSLLVDSIGDVVEVEDNCFEAIPENLGQRVRRLLSGVYKMDSNLLSVIEIEKLNEVLNQKETENAA